jgi:antitoxin component YwqK of YwqJK toxin-antitoxin module
MKRQFTLFVCFLLILNFGRINAGNSENFQNDPLNGPKREYYPNGKVMKEYSLKDGKIEGSYRTYDMLGRLVSDQFCKNGVPDGSLKTYYPGGQLKSEGVVRPDGDISGPSREYFENGNIKIESMISGKFPNISSQTKIYSEDGKLRSESTSSNGEFSYSITYDKEGRVTSEQKPGQIISYWYERDTGKKHTSINGVEQK